MDASDGHLVEQTLAGRKTAFDELVRRYHRQAMTVSYRFLNSTHDAAEVTQEAFLKAYSSLESLEEPEAFRGWLMRIVSNLSLNYRRSRKIRRQLPLDGLASSDDSPADVPGPAVDPVHGVASKEMGQKLQVALAQLPEMQRMAIVLFTIEQMPQKQVAKVLNCSVELVKWNVFQGRKKLRELLKEYL
ncbi:MAG TPA: sigma-70 family RNA polymerase sigma factor [Tepidisphaeraceae bacterium]|nr:sigma-70 family RNA polymerase sigma factor [Tepidisphaeraceae bacterium]